MANSKGWPAGINWDYDRDELIADGIVHAIGISLAVLSIKALSGPRRPSGG